MRAKPGKGGFMRMGVSGAAELGKVLDQLPPRLGEKALVTALRAGAKPIVKAMKSGVPVQSGELRRSITVRKANRKQRRQGTGRVVIGFKKPTSRRAHLTEFGTAHSRAQPFVRPAVESKSAAAVAAIGAKLAEALAKEAKKLAGGPKRKGR